MAQAGGHRGTTEVPSMSRPGHRCGEAPVEDYSDPLPFPLGSSLVQTRRKMRTLPRVASLSEPTDFQRRPDRRPDRCDREQPDVSREDGLRPPKSPFLVPKGQNPNRRPCPRQ
jgi:hypothetical protein